MSFSISRKNPVVNIPELVEKRKLKLIYDYERLCHVFNIRREIHKLLEYFISHKYR